MINHEYRFIYIHIPRAASTSLTLSLPPTQELEEVLRIPHIEDVKGMSVARMKRLDARVWEEYFRFTFVRNPWSRVVSTWGFLQQLESSWHRVRNFARYLTERRPFCSFVRRIGSYIQDPGEAFLTERWHLLPQYIHLIDKNGNLAVDFVGRFENLQEDFERVCSRLGVERASLCHAHKTRHRHYSEYYDDEARETVAELYREDIVRFGYKFEPQTRSLLHL